MIGNGYLKVVGIGGTLRENSTSLGALGRSLAAAEDAGAVVELLDLNELRLPMYEPGKTLDEYDENVRRLVSAIRGADGLLVSTAAYHGSLAGVTKNALDFVHFLGADEPAYLDGKVVGLISTAGGEQAAANANAAMVNVVHSLRGIVAPLTVGVTRARQRTDDWGEITDENFGRRLDSLGTLVADLAKMVASGRVEAVA
ncbi:MAG TPA: NADPH-dependent FMN reductase [Rubrobacter sp.]|nr:NADPH-dependent FMN reductase [Rubrobacter sp.]